MSKILIRVVFQHKLGKYYICKNMQNKKIVIVLRRNSQGYKIKTDDYLTGNFKKKRILWLFKIRIFHYLTDKEYNAYCDKINS